MLSFFRFNDPYRLVFIFLLLLIIRVPVFFADGILTQADLHFMLIGDKMSREYTLYVHIWDNIAPLAAGVYWLIDLLFGRSLLAYQIISLLLVVFQAGLINKILVDNKALTEISYVPAVIYALCMSLFFDYYTLTPILMSMTFILLALNDLFDHIEIRVKRDERIFNIGLYLGIGALFYLPVILLAPATLLILALFTGTVFRRYLLLVFGVALPFLLVISYYLLIDGVRDFYYNFLNPWMSVEGNSLISVSSLLLIIAVPAVYTFLGMARTAQGARFNNYQIRLSQVMFLWMLFSLGLIFFGAKITPSKLMIITPVMTFYISHYFLSFRKNLKSEIAFGIFVLAVVLVSLGTFFNFFITAKYIAYEKLLIQETPYDKLVEGRSIVVLGDNIDIYKDASLATPYLNWELSRPLFESPEYYDNMEMIYNSFKTDPPEVIIDPYQQIDKIQDHIPWFIQKYKKSAENVYLINN